MIGIVSQELSNNAVILWVEETRRKYRYIPSRSGDGTVFSLNDQVEFELKDGKVVRPRLAGSSPSPTAGKAAAENV